MVPSHGAAGTIPGLLAALRAQTLVDFEVIVVDTGADGTWRALEREAAAWPSLRPLRGPTSGGPAAKRNAGAKAARGSLLAFTDADCLPEPRWLEAGLAALRGGASVVQGCTLPREGEDPALIRHRVVVRGDSGLHETCNIFYQRALFDSLGGFTTRYYERLGVPFGEDAELGWRARRAGARYRFEPEAVVRHPLGAPSVVRHLQEQWLVRAFPALVKDVPELRETLLHRRVFLNRRSAAFAAAVVAAALTPRLPAAGLLALPYARAVAAEMPPRSAGPAARARQMAHRGISDATTLAALAYGSVRARRVVL